MTEFIVAAHPQCPECLMVQNLVDVLVVEGNAKKMIYSEGHDNNCSHRSDNGQLFEVEPVTITTKRIEAHA